MDLYLQFGYGMMAHTKELISKWGDGCVILSPRDMNQDQMIRLANDIAPSGGSTLLDPQFYQPHSDHENLLRHSFWPADFETDDFYSGTAIKTMLQKLWVEYNEPLKAAAFIIPSGLCTDPNEDWKNYNDTWIEKTLELGIPIPKIATLCLSSEILRSESKIHEILEHSETWGVDGFYVVAQTPQGKYLAADAIWLSNLIDLCAGLKLRNKKVIMGYANHQHLYLALAKIDAIASGTWLNVRMFPIEKFTNPEEDAVSRRSTWYYCPQTLSEYQITFLDIAQKTGILTDLKTDELFQSDYADVLFAGAQPTTVAFSEREAFRHYLQCLKVQASGSVKSTYDETINYLRLQYKTAADLLSYFQSRGVRGKDRDFSEVLDFNHAALDSFAALRGFIYRHKWNSI